MRIFFLEPIPLPYWTLHASSTSTSCVIVFLFSLLLFGLFWLVATFGCLVLLLGFSTKPGLFDGFDSFILALAGPIITDPFGLYESFCISKTFSFSGTLFYKRNASNY